MRRTAGSATTPAVAPTASSPLSPDFGLAPAVAGFVVGGRTIAAALAEAIADGRLIENEPGQFCLPSDAGRERALASDTPTISTPGSFDAPCHLLHHFLFAEVYRAAQVPQGCSACFKIWIRPATIRALFALKEVLDATPYSSKIKVEALDPGSPNVYLALVYGGDLSATRTAYASLRGVVDADPRLGPDVPMEIRRGCHAYERACGPSDQYRFPPGLAEVEAALAERFVDARPAPRPKPQRDAAARLRMLQIAFQLGDESYADFTGGEAIASPVVRYSPTTDEET
ncbi:hypothetical protein AB5I39_10530 [Sphingomonas sp. MMS24-J45]|uniref:hypothetical protein n=1 Tax=Sphingomonas sp. MMS24-J45 TaxID=3238806 RepID=UPI00384BC9CB